MSVAPAHGTGNLSHNHQVALDLASKGVKVFPCRWQDGPPDGAGGPQWRAKSPMPRIKWTTASTTDIEIIDAWWEAAPLALVGMPLGQLGMVVLDPDRHPGGPDGIAAFDAMAQTYPGLAEGPYVRTPQGLHYFFLQPETRLGNAQGSLPAGINVRGDGGYVIAPGSRLPDGREWQLVGNLAAARKLPRPIIDMIHGKAPEPEPDQPIGFITYPDDPRQAVYMRKCVENAYAKLSQAKAGDRNNTLFKEGRKLAHLVYGGFLIKQEIVALLREACTVNGLDQDGDAAIEASIQSAFDPAKAEPRDPFSEEDLIANYWDNVESGDQKAKLDPGDIHIWTVDELWAVPPQEFLLDGLIPANAVGLLIGDQQAYKSFMAQSIAVAIAAGASHWCGHAITAPGNAITVYIAGEGGPESASKRLRGWAAHYGYTRQTLRDRFRLITHSIDLMNPDNYIQLVAAITARVEMDKARLALIVIDTINTSAPGADENSTKEMGLLHSISRRISTLFACPVLGVHHINKSGGIRGSNLLAQNSDFLMTLKRTKELLSRNTVFEVTKLKDAAAGFKQTYHLALVGLDDGTTTLVPTVIGSIEAEKVETTIIGRPSSKSDATLDVLGRHPDGLTKSDLCALLEETTKAEKEAVTRLLSRLRQRGLVWQDKSRWKRVESDFFE